jgi:hypothetical protein
MKRCFLVTSLIEVGSQELFKAFSPRSVFDTNERLRQTIAGLLNLNAVDPNTDIILIDASQSHFDDILKLPFVKYYRLADIDANITNEVNTNSSKSYCEALMMKTFLTHSTITKEYDYITKISARYLLDQNYNTDVFDQSNLSNFIFKAPIIHPIKFLHRNFLDIMPIELPANDAITGLYTSVYAVGSKQFDLWLQMLDQVITDTASRQSRFFYVDIEYIFYYYFRCQNQLDLIKQVDWRIYGWGGSDGGFYVV